MAIDILAEALIIDETIGLDDDNVDSTLSPHNNATVTYLLGLDDLGGLSSPQVAFQTNFVTASASAGETINSIALTQNSAGLAFSTTVGVNSGIQTVDGRYVWLFQDVTHANVVIGVIGTSDADAEPVPTLPAAELAFSFALLTTSSTTADLYTVQYVPLLHPIATDPDDQRDLADHVFASVSSTTTVNFSQLGDAPPGHNNWYILDADAASTQKILVTARDNGVQAAVNVSTQGLGVSSQDVRFGRELQIDLIIGGTQSAGKNFTNSPTAPDYVEHIENVSNAGFSISQSTPTNTKADIEIHAYNNNDNAEGSALPGDDNDAEINITGVTFKLNGVATTAAALGITVDLSGSSLVLRGVGEGVTIDFTTAGGPDGTFDRFTIKNIDTDKDYFDVKEVHFAGQNDNAYVEEVGSFINFDDDGPTVTITGTEATLTVDETLLGTVATGDFGPNFTVDHGSDSEADTGALTYALSTPGGASGLVDTLSGEAVILSLSGSGAVEGRTATGGDLVFTVSVDADGNVTLDQARAVVHDTADHDESTGLLSDNLIQLTATATDGDGDTDSETIDIGQNLEFRDDGPSIDRSLAGVPTLTTDDTAIEDTAATSFAGLFTAGDFGNDSFKDTNGDNAKDANAIRYALSVSLAGAESGLVDTLSGDKIYLFLESGVVRGRVGLDDNAGANLAGAIAFTISVNADSGAVTLVQSRSVVHNDSSDPAEIGGSAAGLASAGLVKLTATIEDGDGDTDTAVADIGEAFKFTDDGPSIDRDADPVTYLVTDDTDIPDTTGAISFAGLFTAADFGKDGFKDSDDDGGEDPDAIRYGLSLKDGDGTISSLVDTESNEAILLRVTLDGDVEGYLASDDTVVFLIDLDPDTGDITLTQNRAIVHGDPGDSQETGDSAESMAADLIVLTATIIDGDGDTDTAVADIGDAFRFEDDGPTASIALTGGDAVTDESTGADVGDGGLAEPDDEGVFSPTLATADRLIGFDQATLVTTAGSGFGNDPGGSSGLSLLLNPDNNDSGLTTTDGTAILLFKEGDVVVGRAGTEAIFAIAIGANGQITVEQYDSIEHTPVGTFDNVARIAADRLYAVVTVSDGDSDSASDAVDIGQNVGFEDDGPVATLTLNDVTLVVDESVGVDPDGLDTNADDEAASVLDPDDIGYATILGSVLFNTSEDGGEDEEGETALFSLRIQEPGLTQLVASNSGEGVVLEAESLTSVVGRADGQIVFRITIDAVSGNVTMRQYLAVEHDLVNNVDEATAALGEGVLYAVYTVTDGDGDMAVPEVDLGDIISIQDDGPRIGVGGAEDLEVGNDAGDTATGTVDFDAGSDSDATWSIVDAPGAEGTSASGFAWQYVDHDIDGVLDNGIRGTLNGVAFYDLSINDDGEYIFELLSALTGTSIFLDIKDIKAGGPQTNFIDVGTLTTNDFVRISGFFDADAAGPNPRVGAAVNESNANVGVINGNLDANETLTFSLYSPDGSDAGTDPDLQQISGITIGTKTAKSTTYDIVAYRDGQVVFEIDNRTIGKNGQLIIDSPPGAGLFDTIEITSVNGVAVKIGLADISIRIAPPDYLLTFGIELDDSDLDPIGTTFTVGIDGNGDGSVTTPIVAMAPPAPAAAPTVLAQETADFDMLLDLSRMMNLA